MSYTPGAVRVAAVDRQLRDHDIFLAKIRERLILAQDTMREHQNKKRRHLEFAIGDWVLLRVSIRGQLWVLHPPPLPSLLHAILGPIR